MLHIETKKWFRSVMTLVMASLAIMLPTESAFADQCTFAPGTTKQGPSFSDLEQAVITLINAPATTTIGPFGISQTTPGYVSPYDQAMSIQQKALSGGGSIADAAAAAASAPPLPLQLINYGFSASDPKLSQNLWVLYMFPSEDANIFGFRCSLQNAPDAATLQKLESMVYFGNRYKTLPLSSTITTISPYAGIVPPAPITNEFIQLPPYNYMQIVQSLVNLQAFLNNAVKYSPGLVALLIAKQYDKAFQYASQHNLMNFVDMSTGFQVLGMKPLSAADMTAYYAAAQRNWNLFYISAPEPYAPSLKWSRTCPVTSANANIAASSANGFPDIARYCGHIPSQPFFEKWVVPILEAAILGTMSAGFASGIAGAMSTTTVAAGSAGTTVATTSIGTTVLSTTTISATGAVVGSSTTLAGAAVSIGTSAIASATVTTVAQGGAFGKNLVSSLEGSALGTGLAQTSIPTNMSSSLMSDGLNKTASNFVTSLATGTVSGLVLNGGNFNQAFTSAVTSSVGNSLDTGMSRLPASASNTSYSFDPNSTQSTGNIDSAAAARAAYVNGTSMNGSTVANDFQPANLQPLTIAQLNQSAGAVDLSNIPMPVVNVAMNENPASGTLFSGSNGSYGGTGASGASFNNMGSVAQASDAFANEVNNAVGINPTYSESQSSVPQNALSGDANAIPEDWNTGPSTSTRTGSILTGTSTDSGYNVIAHGYGSTSGTFELPSNVNLTLINNTEGNQLSNYAVAGYYGGDLNAAATYNSTSFPAGTTDIPNYFLSNANDVKGSITVYNSITGTNVIPDLQTINSPYQVTLSDIVAEVSQNGGGTIVLGACTGSCPTLATQYTNTLGGLGPIQNLSGAAADGTLSESLFNGSLGNFAESALPAAADGANLVGLGFSVVNATHTQAANYLANTWQNGGLHWWNPNADVQYGVSAGINGLYNNVVNPAQTWVDNQVTGSSFYQNNIADSVPVNSNVEATQQMINQTYGGATTDPNSANVIQANQAGDVVAPDGTWLTIPEANSQGYIAPQIPTVTITAPSTPSTLGSLMNTVSSAVSGAYTALSNNSHGSSSIASTAPPAPTSHAFTSAPRTSPVVPSRTATPSHAAMPNSGWIRGSGFRGYMYK